MHHLHITIMPDATLAHLPTEPAFLPAGEVRLRPRAEEVVDENRAGVELGGDLLCEGGVFGPDRSVEAVGGGVGEGDGGGEGGEGADGEDRTYGGELRGR